jgi:plasmid stabilization system protein ParE
VGESSLKVRLARAARRDLLAVLKRSLKEFGERAAVRYDALIK